MTEQTESTIDTDKISVMEKLIETAAKKSLPTSAKILCKPKEFPEHSFQIILDDNLSIFMIIEPSQLNDDYFTIGAVVWNTDGNELDGMPMDTIRFDCMADTEEDIISELTDCFKRDMKTYNQMSKALLEINK